MGVIITYRPQQENYCLRKKKTVSYDQTPTHKQTDAHTDDCNHFESSLPLCISATEGKCFVHSAPINVIVFKLTCKC